MDNETCSATYANLTQALTENGTTFCPTFFDKVLCWGPTAAAISRNVSQKCPGQKGIDTAKLAWRICNPDGTWNHNNKSDLINKGYTDYFNCYTPTLADMVTFCDRIGKECLLIVDRTRIIEMVGLTLSLFALIISLIIFSKYRILRNNRTTIHKHLFFATVLQVIMRLILYIDQEFKEHKIIENVPYLCESCYALLEFSKMACIMWMFIEGLSLHNAMTVTVFKEYSFLKMYLYGGWLASTLLTATWAISMIFVKTEQCWYLYNFQANYWILEGPSTALIVINMLFLLNIIRILVMKLRDSNMGEIQQIRKAVRAAILLVPLMGTANILFMIKYTDIQYEWQFALWSYTTYFLTTFQGLFIATLYCFMNGEVRDVIRNNFSLYMSLRTGSNFHHHRRNSTDVTRLSSVDPEV